jgi:hypothetical protein
VKTFINVSGYRSGPAAHKSVEDWVASELRAIRSRFEGVVDSPETRAAVKASVEELAAHVWQMTGVKPSYTLDIHGRLPLHETYAQAEMRRDQERELERRAHQSKLAAHYARRDELRAQALAKLTAEDREVLGLD